MIQSSKQDKVWQIERMYSIYIHSNPCLVLPGGLVRLASLDEPTTWIDRAWTLQEAAANTRRDTIKCIYTFPYETFNDFADTLLGKGYSARFINYLHNGQHKIFTQYIIEPGHSAGCDMADLYSKLMLMLQFFQLTNRELSKDLSTFPLRIVSAPAGRLLGKSIFFNDSINYPLFWKSAFVRSSSRPVDMVFSIMGPLGVQLKVAEFQDHERTKATIKLIQALLQKDHSADWLFIAPELPPAPELSILPLFPETSESGRAMLRMPNGDRVPAFEIIGMGEIWLSEGAPRGSMDDDGYFHFHARGVQVPERGAQDIWAVIVGSRHELNRDPTTGLISGSRSRQPMSECTELTLMFISLHSSSGGLKLYHRIGMEHEIDETLTKKWKWVENSFRVGGRGRGERVRFAVREHGPVYATSEDIERENALKALANASERFGGLS